MKSRRWLIIGAAILVVALVVVLLIVRPGSQSASTPTGKDPASAIVGVDGGTFTFDIHDGLAITVPKGAVDAETTLTVTQPRTLESNEGPFGGLRKAGLSYDITLSRGDRRDIQPLQPLEAVLPAGAPDVRGSGTIPLLYTPGPTPGSYLWLPSRIEGEQLRVSIGHLSPKYLVYVEGKTLLDTFMPAKAEVKRDECSQEATIAAQKVRLKPTGWSLNDDSPIFGCLLAGPNGSVGVGVSNRFDYILVAAATNDVKDIAVSQGTFEDEMAKYVAGLLPGGDKIKAYIPRDSKLTGQIAMGDLPATVEVRGDPRTFMSENAVRILSLAVGLITGEGDAGKTMKVLGSLLKKGELTTCLQKSLGSLTGDLTIKAVADATGNCFIAVFNLLAEQIDFGKALWRVGWLLDAFKGIADTAISAINGIRLELVNTMRIEVVADVPPCPTGAALLRVLQTGVEGIYPNEGLKVRNPHDTKCQSPWAFGAVELGTGDSQTDTSYAYVLHYEGGAWKQVAAGQDIGGHPYCAKAPPVARELMGCRE